MDTTLAVSALVSLVLIVAGNKLMMNRNIIYRNFGLFTFVLGILLLGNTIGKSQYNTTRYVISMVSVLLIMAGTLITHNHFFNRQYDTTLNTIPTYSYILLFAGYIGIIVALSLNDNGSFNMTKGLLALIALLVIWWAKNKYIHKLLKGEPANKERLAHLISLLLLVLLISYQI